MNPLRGRNNVQGSCDRGSFPHELPGNRHVGGAEVRELFGKAWGVTIQPEPGLRIPNMVDAALAGQFKRRHLHQRRAPILSQYNVGAHTRRTFNSQWHDEDRLEIHPQDGLERGVKQDDWVGITRRAGATVLRAEITERVQPGLVYTTFHFPESGANVITTDRSGWAANCPEYKVTAMQVMPVAQPTSWQRADRVFSTHQERLLADARLGAGVTVAGK